MYHGGREQGAKGKSRNKFGEEDEGKRDDEGELVPSIEASMSIPWPSTCKSPHRANKIYFLEISSRTWFDFVENEKKPNSR